MFGEILGLVWVCTWGVWRETWFSGGEYMRCLERDLI